MKNKAAGKVWCYGNKHIMTQEIFNLLINAYIPNMQQTIRDKFVFWFFLIVKLEKFPNTIEKNYGASKRPCCF